MNRAFYVLVLLLVSPTKIAAEDQQFFVPNKIPKSHYKIDAKINVERGVVSGSGEMRLVNSGSHPIGTLGVDWSLLGTGSLEIQTPAISVPSSGWDISRIC